jgi:hypothetical protein
MFSPSSFENMVPTSCKQASTPSAIKSAQLNQGVVSNDRYSMRDAEIGFQDFEKLDHMKHTQNPREWYFMNLSPLLT